MARILAVGIATLDWIHVVEDYPQVDTEIRAQQQHLLRGGNATNTLVVLSQLGHQCGWLGTLADDYFADLICRDLNHFNIDYKHCPRIDAAISPSSHILLSTNSASRNIVHYRALRELQADDYKNVDFSPYEWIHFEGRNIPDTLSLMKTLKRQYPTIPLSLEVEKPRENIEQLFAYADHCLFSRHYVRAKGYESAQAFLQENQVEASMVCAWGQQGAFALSDTGKLLHADGLAVNSIDTRAAGDVFNAAYIHACLQGMAMPERLEKACYLAGMACTRFGLDNIATF